MAKSLMESMTMATMRRLAFPESHARFALMRPAAAVAFPSSLAGTAASLRLRSSKPTKHFAAANKKSSMPSKWQSNPMTHVKTLDSLTDSEMRKTIKDLRNTLIAFGSSKPFIVKCRRLGLNDDVATDGFDAFCDELFADQLEYLTTEDLVTHFIESPKIDRVIFPAFSRFLAQKYPSEIGDFAELIDSSDMRTPAMVYKAARNIKRKIVMHVGPTNSGKTHAALESFKKAGSAIYCGPLRLLAHEVYSRMNRNDVTCNLLTGEERRESDGVFKWSCTVEMAILNRTFDVAIVDEIQMIGDVQRGWAWTQALLGLQATEVHLCGEASAVDIVRELCATTGDELHINEYKRLTQLTVCKTALESDMRNIEPGDAIVVFSRKNIFMVKNLVEKHTQHRAAVIYGSLPPESRAEQARLFNDPQSPFQVLVASDAIGMGLNLNIRRIVFFTMDKYNGEDMVPLSTSQTKQIAGRAGRYGTQWENGMVTVFDPRDMKQLNSQMRMPVPKVMSAGLMPSFDQVQKFSEAFPQDPLEKLLTKFEDIAQMGGKYVLCNLDTQREIAKVIQGAPMSMRDQYCFVQAPCNVKETPMKEAVERFALAHAEGVPVTLQDVMEMDEFGVSDTADASPSDAPTDTNSSKPVSSAFTFATVESLHKLETKHRVIILYLWLSMRFPGTFTDPDQAMAYKQQCEEQINSDLMNMMPRRLRRSHGHSSMQSTFDHTADNAATVDTDVDVSTGRVVDQRSADALLGVSSSDKRHHSSITKH